jgi:hypothetical protein
MPVPDQRRRTVPEIRATLCLSTCHVDGRIRSEDTTRPNLGSHLQYLNDDDFFCPCVEIPGGWFITLPDEENEPSWAADALQAGVPKALVDLVRYALALDCQFLLLDADGPIMDGLPVYSW